MSVLQFANLSGLKAFSPSACNDDEIVYLLGRNATNDGAEGLFRLTDTNPGAANDATIVALTVGGWWAVRQFEGAVAPLWFKAAGATDDKAALKAAMESGYVVDGQGRSYAVNGLFTSPTSLVGFHSATIVHGTPTATNARALVLTNLSGFFVRNVKFELGSGYDSSAGNSDFGGLYMSGCSNFQLEDIEARGGMLDSADDTLTGIVLTGCHDFTAASLFVHDLAFMVAAVNSPTDDVLQGILLNDVERFSIDNCRAENLNGFVRYQQSATGNGTSTAFPLSFPLPSGSALTVTVNGVPKTLGADYTVSSTAVVTFATAPASAAAILVTVAYTESHTGDGSTTTFAWPYPFLSASDLTVRVAGVLKTLGSDYTVTSPDLSGSITFSVAPANSATVDITMAGIPVNRYSRGFAISGCENGTFTGCQSTNVDQPFDMSGSNGNRHLTLSSCLAIDGGAWGFKNANSSTHITYNGCIARSCSAGGFVTSVNSGMILARDILYNGCIAYDIGWPFDPRVTVPRAFMTLVGTGSPDDIYPRGIKYSNCVAYDEKAIANRTMAYGFHNQAPAVVYDSSDDTTLQLNELFNCNSYGHTTAPFLGFHRHICRLSGSSTQTIPNAIATAVAWDTELEDSAALHDPLSNTTIRAKKAGSYAVNGVAVFAQNATGLRQVQLYVNGTAVAGTTVIQTNLGAGTATYVPFSFVVSLAETDLLDVRVWQNSGGSLNLNRTLSSVNLALQAS